MKKLCFMWSAGAPLFLLFSFLIVSPSVLPSDENEPQAVLAEIVPMLVTIIRKHGYEAPDYRVFDGHTDVPVSAVPATSPFFGYVRNDKLNKRQTIVLHFYQVDKLSAEARVELINYVIHVYEEKNRGLSFSLRMMRAVYKKPQIMIPEALVEINLNALSL